MGLIKVSMATNQAGKEEVDAGSVYVSNVRKLIFYFIVFLFESLFHLSILFKAYFVDLTLLLLRKELLLIFF